MVEVGNAFEMSSMHGKWRRVKRERCRCMLELHDVCLFGIC